MAFDTKVRKLWAILAIPAILLGIGASYERGGLAGLRDMTLDMLKSAGIYRPAPDETLWLSIRDSRDSTTFAEFLKKFPNSPHAQEARAKLEELQNTQPMTTRMPMREQDRTITLMPPR
jgi:hypothetical protein